MEIKYGLISSDSHGQLGKDAYTSRMSTSRWGNRIPQIVEVRDDKFESPVERWSVNGEIQGATFAIAPLWDFQRIPSRSDVEPKPARLFRGYKRYVVHPEEMQNLDETAKLYSQILKTR